MMKRWIAVALLLAWASGAQGQSKVHDGQSFRGVLQGSAVTGIVRADSTGKLLTTDNDGNLWTREYAPPQTFLRYHPDIIQTKLVPGNQDTSTAKIMLGANRIYVGINYTFEEGQASWLPDSTGAVLIFLGVRAGPLDAVDSTKIYNAAVIVPPTAAGSPDSIGSFSMPIPAATTARRYAEIPIVLKGATHAWRHIYFELRDPESGQPITGPYIQLYVRVAETYDADLAARSTDTATALGISVWGVR